MRSLVVALVAALTMAACGTSVARVVGDDPGWRWTRQAGPLTLGITHTQFSLAPTDPSGARARGAAILRQAGRLQVQHLMGFGTLNPEPSPGRFDWSTLDTRMALVRATGGTPVLTCAVAPDWMKGGRPGTTDWSRVEVAPLPEHYDDFARLCARAVARYPQVRTVQVWNELKGFFDAERNDWDVEGYTRLYNAVHRAVKAVRPDVAIGGPYIPLDAWADPDVAPSDVRGPWGIADRRSLRVVEYWLANNEGADLLVVDGGTATKDRGLVTTPSRAVERFAALTTWLRQRSPLPVWWSEFYAESGTDGDAASPASAAATLQAVAAFARTGVAAALLWQPQAAPSLPYAALWTDTADPEGGRPTALTEAWTWLAPRLARGEVDLGRSPGGQVLGFRAPDGLVLVNTTGEATMVGTAEDPLELDPYAAVVL